jgi:hypothetical protein
VNLRFSEQRRFSRRTRRSIRGEGFDFGRCRICGDHRRVISGRHFSKHGTDREEYMDEYHLSPDELIAKDFRKIQSSRRGYQPLGKSDWAAAIKRAYKRDGNVFAKRLQKKHPHLYTQGVWIFGDWDNALRAAELDPERTRLHISRDREKNHNGDPHTAKGKFAALCEIRDEKPSQAILGSTRRIRIVE